MIGKQALKVTILSKGTYQKYMAAKQQSGADLAHLKPAHMNATDDMINMLRHFSEDGHDD